VRTSLAQLGLDQELARTGGGTLLTATHPLTVAAVAVPGHRHARFASLRIAAEPADVAPGAYIVVLAKASAGGSGGGDEIWGAGVTLSGRNAGEEPAHALLAALAEGRLADNSMPEVDDIERLAEQAMDQLHLRHSRQQVLRDREFRALQDARRITLAQQHTRRMTTIAKRVETATVRGRDRRTLALFESQGRRAEERYRRLQAELDSRTEPEIRLEWLAVCVVTIEEGERCERDVRP
jgi:hypothetical protein